MAVTEAEVVEALRPVEDPELHMSIVDLDMVRGVSITGARVRVTIALTVPGCPLRAEITKRVTDAVTPLAGVDAVDVELTVMAPEELEALRTRLRSGGHAAHGDGAHAHGGGQQPLGHEQPGRPIPFMEPGSKTRVLGINSGKGGVGKSSVTVNLAIALTKLGHDVAILDADVYGFSIPKMLGITDAPTILADDIILPPVGYDVKCISMGFFVEDARAVIWRGPMLHKALHQFLTDFYWGDPDYLLIDMPPGTGDVALSMAQYLPKSEIYVVTTPQPAAQRVAQRSAAMAKEVHLPVRGVIENMSFFTGDDGKRYEIFGSGGGASLAAGLGVPLLAQIPLVPELREGGDVGVPVTIAEPHGDAAQAFERLAKEIDRLGPARVYRSELKIN